MTVTNEGLLSTYYFSFRARPAGVYTGAGSSSSLPLC